MQATGIVVVKGDLGMYVCGNCQAMLADRGSACGHCGSSDVQAFGGVQSTRATGGQSARRVPAPFSSARDDSEYVGPSVPTYAHAHFVANLLVAAAWVNLFVGVGFGLASLLFAERGGWLVGIPAMAAGIVAYVLCSAVSNLLNIACDVGRASVQSAAALSHLARRAL